MGSIEFCVSAVMLLRISRCSLRIPSILKSPILTASYMSESHASPPIQPEALDVFLSSQEMRQADYPLIRVSLTRIAGDTSTSPPSGGGNEDEIPESVLQYQRQLRKAQHARKVCRTLAAERDLRVVYVDEHIIVVNKPPGVLTVPGINHNNNSLLNLVCDAYPNPDMVPATRIIHRLDMDTSGLVIFSRSPQVTKTLHASFREHQVTKEYECLVMGNWGEETVDGTVFHVDLPLQRDHEHPPFMRVSTPRSEVAAMAAVDALQQHGFKKLVRKKPKQSETRIRVVHRGTFLHQEQSLPFTRLRLEPITGRTHQLRVHCAALGFPILGDPTYTLCGEAAPEGGLAHTERTVAPCPISIQRAWAEAYPCNTQPMCLHAALLQLEHPVTKEKLKFELSPEFQTIFDGDIVEQATP